MLHYNPRHVSSINMPIFRRTNCIITTSSIVTLCKGLYSMPDESSLLSSGILYRVYSLTMRMSNYNPRHISSINMPIFRRTNCIITASGFVILCKRLYSMPDESRLQSRCCDNTTCPPEDGHVDARNMWRIVI